MIFAEKVIKELKDTGINEVAKKRDEKLALAQKNYKEIHANFPELMQRVALLEEQMKHCGKCDTQEPVAPAADYPQAEAPVEAAPEATETATFI